MTPMGKLLLQLHMERSVQMHIERCMIEKRIAEDEKKSWWSRCGSVEVYFGVVLFALLTAIGVLGQMN